MSPQAQTVSLSNQSDTPSGGDGIEIGQAGSSDGFFGAVPVPQPTGAAQAALTRGLQAGTIATFGTLQSPAAVAQGTTAEQNLTVQTGTGFQMQLLAGDMVFVNKPTQQAGLGYGNCRVQASNVVGLTYINVPAAGGNITPTASQNYSVVGLRGVPKLTPSLSPASVAANTTIEQQFTVTGLQPGYLAQVNKPTAQAGLDIVGCRVVSNNVLGITFCNVTASPIVPTAAETYNVFAMPGLDAVGNEIYYGFNAGTVGAITAGVVISGGSTTLTGLLASDMVSGLFKPTPQATATNIATPIYGIPTADTLTMYFLGTGTGSTPTASEVYGVRTTRLNPKAPMLMYTQTLTPTSVAAATTAEQTFTVTGLVSGTPVAINAQAAFAAGIGIAGVRVSATDTLAITFINTTSAAITPAAFSALIGNFQVPNPGAGNCVYQNFSQVTHGAANLSNAQRAALVALGLLAGA